MITYPHTLRNGTVVYVNKILKAKLDSGEIKEKNLPASK